MAEKKISPQEARVQCVQGAWWREEKCNRADIDKIWIHDTTIHIGGKNKKSYAPYVKRTLEDNFTPHEINRIGNLYIETNPFDLGENVGGANEHFDIEGKAKASIIRIPPQRQGNHKDVEGAEDTLTHESIHALRNVMGRYVEDIDKDESETQLESIARISKDGMDNITTGYYHHIPDLETIGERFKAIDEDRILLNKVYERKRKGDDAIQRVKEKHSQSNISRVQLEESDTENIDRYFLIGTPRGGTIRLHKRYTKGKAPLMKSTKKRLQRRYGEDATIWEWHDGRKVKITGNNTHKKARKPNRNKSYENAMDAYRREMRKSRIL